MRNIEDEFPKWYQDKRRYTPAETALFNAYNECVLQNESTIGDFSKTMELCNLFTEILIKI